MLLVAHERQVSVQHESQIALHGDHFVGWLRSCKPSSTEERPGENCASRRAVKSARGGRPALSSKAGRLSSGAAASSPAVGRGQRRKRYSAANLSCSVMVALRGTGAGPGGAGSTTTSTSGVGSSLRASAN